MSSRRRLVIVGLWITVGALIAVGIDPGEPTATDTLLRLFVVVLTLFLAVVYLLEPWDLATGGSGEVEEGSSEVEEE